MTYLEEYHRMIHAREVIVGEWTEKAVDLYVEDLKNPAYIYDTTEAHKRIKFQENFCLQSKQPYYMKPMELMPWQKAFWECLYSFKMADTGLRRFTEALLEIARKNGKSTMSSAVVAFSFEVVEVVEAVEEPEEDLTNEMLERMGLDVPSFAEVEEAPVEEKEPIAEEADFEA